MSAIEANIPVAITNHVAKIFDRTRPLRLRNPGYMTFFSSATIS